MAYFTVTGLKVLVFLLGVTQGIGPKKDKLPDFSLVANILQTLFKTYTQSLRESRNFVILREKPTQLESIIENFINKKVDQLVPFLQDNDNIKQFVFKDNNNVDDDKNKKLNTVDDNVTLEGEEETTIIEFLPETETQKEALRIKEDKPKEFKDNVKKYKKIRDEIKHALIEESVSLKTQKLVTHTLDDMLAMMVRSQCPQNVDLHHNEFRENLHPRTMAETTKDLAKNWTQQWNAIKVKYNKIWNDHFSHQPNPARKLFMFFEQIQEFLTHIVNDTEHISNNYKVVCKLVKNNNHKEKVSFNNLDLVNFRTGDDTKKHKCPSFKVCSGELRQFMSHLFNTLNETAVYTFRNYAAMYMSDINSDGSGEKETVVAVINKLGETADQKINKVFKKETTKFELDHNKNKDENINRLRNYVGEVVEKSVTSIKNSLDSGMSDLRPRLIESIKQDLSSNIDVDLGNIAAELKGYICRDFSSCNGRMLMRRSYDDITARARHRPIDKNKVYVKLQMNLDKQLKNDIAQGKLDFMDYAFVPIQRHSVDKYNISAKVVNVTRTTRNEKTTSLKTTVSKTTVSKTRASKTTKGKDRVTRVGEDSSDISTEIV